MTFISNFCGFTINMSSDVGSRVKLIDLILDIILSTLFAAVFALECLV